MSSKTFDPNRLGRWTEPSSLAVQKERTISYAAATNDINPWHTEGRLAPPIFAVVASVEVFPGELARIFGDSLYNLGSVHGEQDIFFERPIEPGMTLYTRARVIGVEVKSSGTITVAETETTDERDRLLNRQYAINFLRGFYAGHNEGKPAPGHALSNDVKASTPTWRVSYPVDLDQSLRYAGASGDHGIYHLTDEGARAHGFPRIILHGLCTMAFACRAVVETACADDPRRLRRLAVRFSAPLLPGQDVETDLWDQGEHAGRKLVGFEMLDSTGLAVIRNGLAEVGD